MKSKFSKFVFVLAIVVGCFWALDARADLLDGVGVLGQYQRGATSYGPYVENIDFNNFASILQTRTGAPSDVDVTWSGWIYAETSGDYNFRINTNTEDSALVVSGEVLWWYPGTFDNSASVTLTAGWHTFWLNVDVELGDNSAIAELFWDPPGASPEEIVPNSHLKPNPRAPSDVLATPGACETVDITWTDNSVNEEYFVVERSDDGGSTWVVLDDTLPPDTESYQDTPPEGDYKYRVKACNIGGCSESSSGSFLSDLGGFWMFDDGAGTNADDSSVSNNDGDLMFGPTWVDGINGGAVNFDGVDDSVDIPNLPAFHQVPLTAVIWFNLDVLPSVRGERAALITLSHSSEPWSAWGIEIDTDNIPYVYARDNSGSGDPDDYYWFKANSGSLQPGVWYNVALVIDENYKMTMYVDGQLQSGSRNLPSLLPGNGIIRLGAACNGSIGCLRSDGSMDDVRFYNRVLSESEMLELYENQEASASVAQCIAPAAPSDLTAVLNVCAVDLSWTDNSANEDKFQIERSIDGGSIWIFLDEVPAVAGSGSPGAYQDAFPVPGEENSYRVRACQGVDCSGWAQ